jgi:hypothetical protein
MRTLTSFNGWWGFFFRRNIQISAFITIFMAVSETARYVAILSDVEQPNMVRTPERVQQLYGRVLLIHLKRAGLRVVPILISKPPHN